MNWQLAAAREERTGHGQPLLSGSTVDTRPGMADKPLGTAAVIGMAPNQPALSHVAWRATLWVLLEQGCKKEHSQKMLNKVPSRP